MADDQDPLQEDESGAVDDWLGQQVERDTEVAEAAMDEAGGDPEQAEEIFEQRADGEQRHQEAYPRPGEEPEGGARTAGG